MTAQSYIRCTIRLALWALVMAIVLRAQSDTGRLTGIVTDPSGAVVPKATVTITNEKTGETRKTMTGPDGTYIVPQLGPSTYTLTAAGPGLAPFEHKGVTLQVGQ